MPKATHPRAHTVSLKEFCGATNSFEADRMQDRNCYKVRSSVIDPLTEMLPSTLITAVLTSTLLVTPSLGTTITQASQLKELTYDYIIVGGVLSRLDTQALTYIL